MSKQLGISIPFKIALACLTISVGVNVLTTYQLSRVPVRSRATGPLVGQRVRPITLVSDTAERVDVRFSEGPLPTLFYWFSPTCGWCELNLPNFQALATQAKGKYRFIPVATASPGELARYAERHNITFHLYSMSDLQSQQYHFRGTPNSLLVSSNGTVVGDWYGAYGPAALVDVEKALGVTLPGIAQNASVALQ
jgi:peroxiredoxin